jgi:ABC-type polysaccharide/polyol phosphate export permease
VTAIAEYRGYRELYSNLTLRELRSKYRRSFLGWTWSMLNPLANMAVYTIVFRYFLRIHGVTGHPSKLNVYAIFLLAALLPWNFFQNCVMGSIATLIGNGNLIKKTYFPRELLPAASTGANLVMHLIEIAILTAVVVAFGNWRAVLLLPVTLTFILVLGVFGLGFGLLLGVLNVFFRDIEHFTSIFFLIWLYMTPIVYPETYLSSHHIFGVSLLSLARINPMTDFAEVFRATVYNGTLPRLQAVLYVVFFAAVMLAIGLAVFRKLDGRLAEEL